MKQANNAPIREGSRNPRRTAASIIVLAALWMALAPVVWGQWNTCGTGECITSGSVGIGTTTPGENLTVKGADATLGIFNENDGFYGYLQDTYGTLYLGMALGGTYYHRFAINGTTGAVGSVTNTGTSPPSFTNILDNGSGEASFSGNVGIGTTSPGYKLDVRSGQINSAGGYCINGTNCITSWPSGGGGGGGGSGTVTSITAGTGLTGGTITTSGTLSLNLNSPNTWTNTQTLSVTPTSFPAIHISGPATEPTYPIEGILLDNGLLIEQNNASGTPVNLLTHYYDDNVYLDNSDGDIAIRAGQNTSSYLWVTQAGLGIGTTNPQHPLQVDGTIAASEVIVTTALSDYVFAPDYRLRPLKEVAEYVKDNHHLPDIPSDAEARQTGVSLGDMQSKLLAKIEELTLHMIQAEERNDRLEQQLKSLQDRLEKSGAGAVAK